MKTRFTKGNWFFYLIFCLSLGLTWFFHKDSVKFNDRYELWGDRAGYYIYLPATFFYHFDARKIPADLDQQTGGGLSIDQQKNKIETKYTCGVAILASPFFITAGLISRVAGYDSEYGFSLLYIRMMALAAVVYLILGLWFLKKFLDHYFTPFISYFVVTFIFLGTNLFYYALIDGMMSHVYSFFLFAVFLYSLKRYIDTRRYSFFIVLCIIFSLAILIRPTNILIGLLFFTLDAETASTWLTRFRNLLKPAYFLSFLAILLLIFIPQMVYWKYLSGHWLHFSYTGEGFDNWRTPQVAGVLFSPVNGLIAYSPLVILFLAGLVIMIIKKKANGWSIAAIFLAVTVICASWKMWYFGCSLGQRSFIEYYTVLALPFGYVTEKVFRTRKFLVTTILLFAVFLLTYFNLRYTISLYRFDRCYYGSTWDWDHYLRTVERAGIISPVHQMKSYENDFENLALSPVPHPSTVFTRSGQYSIAANTTGGITPLYTARLNDFGYPWPKMMDVDVWVLKPGALATGAVLGYTLSHGNEVLFGEEQPVDSLLQSPLTWSKISKRFIIPDVNDSSLVVSVFVRNPLRSLFYVEDLKIQYKYKWN